MKLLAICVSAIVLAAVIAAFTTVGSPSKQRAIRFDERRISDLQTLENEVGTYWQINNHLPASFLNLTGVIPTDPETNKPYEYRVKTDPTYELCASFNFDSVNNYPKPYPVYGNETWDHGPGRTCFERTINPSMYPKPLPVNPSIPLK
jgi:hypothetical protein